MTDYIGNYKNRPRRVVFYGRVSTEHEEQLRWEIRWNGIQTLHYAIPTGPL